MNIPPEPKITVPTIGNVLPLRRLFLVYPEHRFFLTGSAKYIRNANYGCSLFSLAVIGVFFWFVIVGTDWQRINIAIGVGIEAVLAIVGVLVVYSYVPRRRLSEQGKLIQGRIVHSNADSAPHFWLGQSFLVTWNTWVIEVTYGFKTPEGKVLGKKVYVTRNDLRGLCPDENTPIVVLYLDEKNYAVL
jgi:hypothetical protein